MSSLPSVNIYVLRDDSVDHSLGDSREIFRPEICKCW